MRITSKFLWGGSVSAHQTEGATDAIYKKGKSIYDELVNEGFGDFSEGIDTYNRYKEDIALFKEMGMNSYRISISWSKYA